ncbi:MAG: formylglycine-generating enzyme family protein [Merismopedia sp. SIO2A8]|nr:formylglycine-generating enzyme family protein [Merismopedia sp. SIO2A8]
MAMVSSSAPTKIRIDEQHIDVQSVREPLSDDVGLVLVQVPGGDFQMGSPQNEVDRFDDEGPQHPVHVRGFWMGRYPVTQAQWRVVAGFPKIDHHLELAPSHFKGDDLPVEQVTWYEAKEFCDRLSVRTGRNYRLPSEAEWEYACRAGTTTPFHVGETITTNLANYRGTDNEERGWSGSYGDGPKGEYLEKTTPVGQFDVANLFGLSDMHGNVWEWCLDHWHDNYNGAPEDGSAWIDEEANADKSRVLRGGSWFGIPGFCRSAYRDSYTPDLRDYGIGFRVVLAPRSASPSR